MDDLALPGYGLISLYGLCNIFSLGEKNSVDFLGQLLTSLLKDFSQKKPFQSQFRLADGRSDVAGRRRGKICAFT